MTKKNPKYNRIIPETALKLVARQGWQELSLEALAKAAKIPHAKLLADCPDKNALLALIVEHISSDTLKVCDRPDQHSTPHDRLFDLMMARFDQLQQNRKAILSIVTAARNDPCMLTVLARAQIKAIKTALDFAGFRIRPSPSPLIPVVVWGVYLATFRIWQSDETLDMSRTMAALDRYLHLALKAAGLLHVNFE